MTRIHFYLLLIVIIIFGCVSLQTLDKLKKNDALVESELINTIDRLVNIVSSQEIVIQSQEVGLAQAENDYAELEEIAKKLYFDNCELVEIIRQLQLRIQELEAAMDTISPAKRVAGR